MALSPEQSSASEDTFASAGPILALGVAATVGALLALVLLPSWVPSLSGTLLGSSPKAYWYLSRGTAFTALALLWISMILGLLITDKMAKSWPGAQAAFAVHEFVSLLGLGFAGFHALVLLGDRFIGYKLFEILLPFASSGYKPFWVGLGQIGLYVWAIVSLSFYVRRGLGSRAWKLIHYASFFNFTVALMHGLTSGTDSSTPWAQAVYWVFAGSVLFLTIYRVVASLAGPEPRPLPARPSPSVVPPPE